MQSAAIGTFSTTTTGNRLTLAVKNNEMLRTRICCHSTNQRTDAVAMNVLDPFEVADIEVYAFYDLREAAQRGES